MSRPTDHLVIGYGEVGRALFAVLDVPGHQVDALDTAARTPQKRFGSYHALHVCTPFESQETLRTLVTHGMTLAHSNAIVVVHSTVPLGTTRKLAEDTGFRCVHSPVRGTHPDLRQGLQTFTKYIGGRDAQAVERWFLDANIRCHTFPDSETTEAIKLWDTTQYGWQIVLAKQIAAWCREHGVDFADVYQQANHDYNIGYESLNRPEVVRPYLKDMPGPIGGHCVMPNLRLLGPNFITLTILEHEQAD